MAQLKQTTLCRGVSGWLRQATLAIILTSGIFGNGTVSHTVALVQEATPSVDESGDYSHAAAAAWLVDQQLPDGGFPGDARASDPSTTVDAVMAGYALGFRSSYSQVLAKARSYLLVHGLEYAALGPGEAAKLTLAAIVLGEDPHAFGGDSPEPTESCQTINRTGGVDLVALMDSSLAAPASNAIPTMYGHDLYDHALILIAYGAIYDAVPASAVELLATTQGPEGGWAVDGSTAPGTADANTTAVILQALAETEQWDNPIVPQMSRRGIEFFHTVQVPDSGFALSATDPLVANANSTALVIRALIAAGEDPSASEWGNATDALARFQTSSGGFRNLMTDDEPSLSSTLQAIPAMAGFPLPVVHICE